MAQEKIPPKQIDALWQAAKALDAVTYPLETSAVRACTGWVDLFIYYDDGQGCTYPGLLVRNILTPKSGNLRR